MRVHMNDRRERLYDDLMDATGYGHKSKALDAAARHYLRMAGGNGVRPSSGAVNDLLEVARDNGSVTLEDIERLLSTEEYPIEVDVRVTHGPDVD